MAVATHPPIQESKYPNSWSLSNAAQPNLKLMAEIMSTVLVIDYLLWHTYDWTG